MFFSARTYHSTAHTAVMELCTKDVAMFLHFHAFLRAESGMGSLLTAALTSVKKPKEEPVVKITELNSIAGGGRGKMRLSSRK